VRRWRPALGVLAGMLVAATPMLVAATPAAADQRISATTRDQFSNPDVTIDQGEHVTFFNGDLIDEHSVTATGTGRDGRPLFDSGVIRPGAEAPVVGVESLSSGSYPFVCTVHPFMHGTITVTGAGTPAPRPPDTTPAQAGLRIGTGNLAAVLRSGRLPLRTTTDEAATVQLTATLRAGRRTVTLARGSTQLDGPGARTERLTLTAAGRRALRRRHVAAVTARASATDTAGNHSQAISHRTLRR
jgi:plastocyanin